MCGNYLGCLLPVDWNGRREDSCGSTGLGRPRRRFSAEEAPRHAPESEAPGVELNRSMSINPKIAEKVTLS